MKKRFSIAALVLVLIFSLSVSARADNTILVNLGFVPVNTYVDQLIGTTPAGTTAVTGGTVPAGCEVVTEPREDGASHYLRGVPTIPGSYEFVLSVSSEETVTALTCALTVNPQSPTVTVASSNVKIAAGSTTTLAVNAETEDGGTLSYLWYSYVNSFEADGQALYDCVGSTLRLTSQTPGITYFFCEVTNTCSGLTATARSEVITVTTELPVVTSVQIKTLPDKTVFEVGDALDYHGLEITARYADGSSADIPSHELEVSPTTLAVAGEQEITVTYQGQTCLYTVVVNEKKADKSLSLIKLPYKTTYQLGETLDSTGLELAVDGRHISRGFSCSPTRLDSAGQQTITVTYEDMSCTFTVTVTPGEAALPEVRQISVAVMPRKLVYAPGEELNTEGLVILVETASESKNVIQGFSCSPTRLGNAGPQEITVSYQGKTCSFFVTVEGEGQAPAATASPAPSVTPADISNHSRSVRLTTVVALIFAVTALAALVAYVYVADRDKLAASLEKLLSRFKK